MRVATRSIHSILQLFKKDNKIQIPSSTLKQIEKLIIERPQKVYHYEIMELYSFLCKNINQTAFVRIDQLLFPSREQQCIQLSLPLAYKRLQCLIKYKMPINSSIEKIREQLYEDKLTSGDFKNLINLSLIRQLRFDSNFRRLLEQVLNLLEQQTPKLDNFTLIALQKLLSKQIIVTPSSLRYQNVIRQIIRKSIPKLTKQQFLFLHNRSFFIFEEVFFQYLLRFRQLTIKKFGFFTLLLKSKNQSQWIKWANQNFSRKQILQKLPSSNKYDSPSLIIEKIFRNYALKRPYIDQFLQFEYIYEGNKKIQRLKDIQKNYYPFLLNLFYYLNTEDPTLTDEQYNRIRYNINQINFLKQNPVNICMFFYIQFILINLRASSKLEKIRLQVELIKKIIYLLKNSLSLTRDNLSNFKVLPIHSFKNVGALELEVYKMAQFPIFFQRYTEICTEVIGHIGSNYNFHQFQQLKKIITEYIKQKPRKSNKIFYGTLKLVHISPEYEQFDISYSHQALINDITSVDYLIVVRDKSTQKQHKYLLDFSNKKMELNAQDKSISNKYWKYSYLVKWCKLNYLKQTGSDIMSFLESDSFGKIMQTIKQNK